MAANKFFGKHVKVLFFFLAIVLLLAAVTPDANAQESNFEAWVFIPHTVVDVDGDGLEESFGARFSVMKDGTVIGSAIIHDGQTTIVYQFTSGGILCDDAGRRYVQLDSKITNQEGQQQNNEIGSFIMTVKPGADAGTLIWDNDGYDESVGFEVQGQMSLFVDPCPSLWLNWAWVV